MDLLSIQIEKYKNANILLILSINILETENFWKLNLMELWMDIWGLSLRFCHAVPDKMHLITQEN